MSGPNNGLYGAAMAIEAPILTDLVEGKLHNELRRVFIKPMHEGPTDDNNRNYVFEGTISTQMLAPVRIGDASSNTQNDAQTPENIPQDGLDHYLLQVITGGYLKGNFNGIDVVAHKGDIVIIDLIQPLSSRVDDGSRITVFIHRDQLERSVGWRELHGLVMRASNPMTRLLFDYLQALQLVGEELNGAETHSAQEAMLSLLGAGIASSESAAVEDLPINLPMRKRILAYIDDNLSNPLLKPHSITQYFRISRSHLYRVFTADGGVAKVIRNKRLDRASRILISQSGKAISFKEVAYRCGFHDGAQFAKAFTARFGMSPKDARAMGASLLASNPTAFSYTIHLTKEVIKTGVTKP